MFFHYQQIPSEITIENCQNFPQSELSTKNPTLLKKETSKPEIEYLLELKKKLANQEADNDN